MDIEVRYNVADISTRPVQEIEAIYVIDQTGSGSSGASSMDLCYFPTDGPQTAQTLLSLLAQTQQDPEDQLTSKLPADLPTRPRRSPARRNFWSAARGRTGRCWPRRRDVCCSCSTRAPWT